MRLLALLLAAAWALSGLPAAAAGDDNRLPGIKGKDDRRVEDSTVFPWRAIGRLNDGAGAHCTAAVVGPRTVLTAAHCLRHPRTGVQMPASAFHFLAGWHKESYLAHARGTAIVVDPKYDGANLKNRESALHDWALVTLDQDVAARLGRFEVVALDAPRLAELIGKQTAFVVAGYAQDRAEVLTADAGCRRLGFFRDAPLLAHGCDAVGGDSGGPIFYRDGDSYRIVGVHIATRVEPGKEAIGIAVPGATFAAAVKRAAP